MARDLMFQKEIKDTVRQAYAAIVEGLRALPRAKVGNDGE